MVNYFCKFIFLPKNKPLEKINQFYSILVMLGHFVLFFFGFPIFLEKKIGSEEEKRKKKKKETDFYLLLWRLCSCHGDLYGLPRQQCRQVSVSSRP